MVDEQTKRTLFYPLPDDLLDVAALEKRVDAVLNADLYWFPVRHHSPTVARLLQQVIEQRQPKIVFIEGPSDCNHLIPHLLHKDSQPPFALYSSYRDDDNVLKRAGIDSPAEDIPARFASWYPMLAYSPEYVALQTAQKISAVSCFIDLPHYSQLKPAIKDADNSDNANDPAQDNEITPITTDDQLLTQSAFYQGLAKSAGYQSWDETWDSLFEFGAYADNADVFRRELATFCAAARLTTAEQTMQEDGTYAREAYMRHQIQQQLAQHDLAEKDAMVICGGFHLFMDKQRNDFPQAPKGTIYNSLVPYSFFRLSELSGYRAGNRAPYYYQKYWLSRQKKQSDTLITEYIVDVLKKARQKGEALSVADAIAIRQHSEMLAQLRHRRMPILDDLYDAIMACCCKGNPATDGLPLSEAIDHVNIGRKIGKVTDQVGQLPIVKDYYQCLHQLDLHALLNEEKTIQLKLNLQENLDQQRSTFLHRLRFLKIPNIHHIEQHAALSATLFKEQWSLVWSPDIENKLLEENLYGDTIENAIMARLQESVARHTKQANVCCRLLYNAIIMQLPCLMQDLAAKTAYAIAHDPQLISLTEAISHLLNIEKISDLRQGKKNIIHQLIHHAYERSCFAISDSIHLPEAQQEQVVEALKILAELLFNNEEMDRALFISNIQTAAQQTEIPYLKGALQGLLAELKVVPVEAVLHQLAAYSQAPKAILVQAGDFLAGLLSVSRTSIITGSPQLIDAIEALFKYTEHDVFLLMLPKMRGAFEQLDRHSKVAIADKVAQQHGLKESTKLLKLNTSLEAATLMAKLDTQVSHIMQAWEF